MTQPSPPPSAFRILVSVAAVIVIVAGMKAAVSILVPFLLSLFVAIISLPPLQWLRRRGLPGGLAVATIVVAILAFWVGLGFVAGSAVQGFGAKMPAYQERIEEETAAASSWLGDHGFEVPEGGLRDAVDPGWLMDVLSASVSQLGSMLANSVLILLTVIFVLIESTGFGRKLAVITGNPDKARESLQAFTKNINRYVAMKSLMSLATAVLVAVWLAILGVDFPLLWGLLAFLLNFVPNLGSILAAIPAVLIAFIELGVGTALSTAAGYVVVNFVIGNVVEPRFMGRGLDLSTLVVFLSLVFWGWVLGPIGMLLSVPLTMTVRIAVEAYDETRWIAVLLGGEPRAPEAVR